MPCIDASRGRRATFFPQQKPERSRGDLLVVCPTSPVPADVRVGSIQLGETCIDASADADAWTAALGTRDKRHNYDHSSTGIGGFGPCSRERYGQVGPPAMKFLDNFTSTTAGVGTISKHAFLENGMRRLPTTPFRGIAIQACQSVPMQGSPCWRLEPCALLLGLQQPMDELLPKTAVCEQAMVICERSATFWVGGAVARHGLGTGQVFVRGPVAPFPPHWGVSHVVRSGAPLWAHACAEGAGSACASAIPCQAPFFPTWVLQLG